MIIIGNKRIFFLSVIFILLLCCGVACTEKNKKETESNVMEAKDIILYDFSEPFTGKDILISENAEMFDGEPKYGDIGDCLGIRAGGADIHEITLRDQIVRESFADRELQNIYLRLWVNNPGNSSVELSLVLQNDSGTSDEIILKGSFLDAAGQNITSDLSGSAIRQDSVQVAAGFCGWIRYPLEERNLEEVTQIVLYSHAQKEAAYYIDNIMLTAQEKGIVRFYENVNRPYTSQEEAELVAGVMDQVAERKADQLGIVSVPEFDMTGIYKGIKAYTYDGMMEGGQKTKVFAYVGIPSDIPKGRKVPGVVLVHGGGGHAFPDWIKSWTDRGYAAIAMDTTGYFPDMVNAGAIAGVTDDWVYGLHGIFKEDGYLSAPDNDDMNAQVKVEKMWMYHAAGQVLLAHSVLASFEEVDSSQIGVIGISWGSVITSLVIGYENKYAFAVPIYGSGYLEESLSWMGDKFKASRTQALWSAQDRFDGVKIPVLWLCMNDDTCFSINTNSKSYLDTAENNADIAISMKSGWIHGHDCCWNTAQYPCHESYIFADSVTGKGGEYTTVTQRLQTAEPGNTVSCTFRSAKNAEVSAKLYYLEKRFAYTKAPGEATASLSAPWQSETVQIDKKTGTVTAVVPEGATCYYIELTTQIDGITYITSSEFINLKKR